MSVERRYALIGHTHDAGGGGTWGSITGTLSNQTDLWTVLNAKLSTDYLSGRATSDGRTVDTVGIGAYYHSSAAVDLPSGVTDQSLLSLSYSADWTTQIGHDWRTNTVYTRTQNNGAWGSWAALSKAGHTHAISALTDLASAWNDMDGQTHGYYTDFNAPTRYGPVYIGAGFINGPSVSGAAQWYATSQGLGSNYTYAQYAMQMAIPRQPLGGTPHPHVRFKENGSWGGWMGLWASGVNAYPNDVFTYDGDSLPHYGLSWYSDSAAGGAVAGLTGYSGIRLFTAGTPRVFIDSSGNTTFGYPTYHAAAFRKTSGGEFQFYGQGSDTVYASYWGGATNTRRGYVYGDADGFGLLGGDGSWAVRVLHTRAGGESFIVGATGTYGSATILGSKNGWCGLRLESASNAPYLMFNTGGLIGGFYSESASWFLYYTGTQWQGPGGQALAQCNWAGSCIISHGTGTPSGGADGDIYMQHT